MKSLLFIFVFLFIQEPVKLDTAKVVPKLDITKEYRSQNMKLDSIIATKNAELRYNLKDSIK